MFKSLATISIVSLIMIGCGSKSNHSETNYIVKRNFEVIDATSKDSNERISSLVFHYTALNFEQSLRVLTSGGVSAHWLIPETGNSIYKLVDENKRAYHAGVSSWKRRTDLNDTSVGVEIVNLGYKCKSNPSSHQCSKEDKEWFPYTEDQIKLIVELGVDIQKRYNIDPLCVVGHSDIALGRKVDPGPYFPWQTLSQNGVGAWVSEVEIMEQFKLIEQEIINPISDLTVQTRLYEFGYDIKNSNVTDISVDNEISNKVYNNIFDKEGTIKSWKKIPFTRLDLLSKLNDFVNLTELKLFDAKLSNTAKEAFLMHYLPEDFLSNKEIENKKILATIQALLLKYPSRAKIGCGF